MNQWWRNRFILVKKTKDSASVVPATARKLFFHAIFTSPNIARKNEWTKSCHDRSNRCKQQIDFPSVDFRAFVTKSCNPRWGSFFLPLWYTKVTLCDEEEGKRSRGNKRASLHSKHASFVLQCGPYYVHDYRVRIKTILFSSSLHHGYSFVFNTKA